jgi:hypothetical protein
VTALVTQRNKYRNQLLPDENDDCQCDSLPMNTMKSAMAYLRVNQNIEIFLDFFERVDGERKADDASKRR